MPECISDSEIAKELYNLFRADRKNRNCTGCLINMLKHSQGINMQLLKLYIRNIIAASIKELYLILIAITGSPKQKIMNF